MTSAARVGALLSLVTFGAASTASAQTVREARDALAGLHRVPLAVPGETGITIGASAGFGLTEAVLETDDAHSRLLGGLAVGVRPTPWLGLSLSLDGRADSHTTDNEGDDDGMVGDPRLRIRAGSEVSEGISLGAELGVWAPGEDAPSIAFDAISLDLRAIATWEPAEGPLTLSAFVGYRVDQSAAAIDDADLLSRSDRLSLGLSDFDALLIGVGGAIRAGALQVLAEWSYDMLIGDGAPDALVSPMRAAVGGRYSLNRDVAVQLVGEFVLSDRPTIAVGAPLVPLEPRATVLASMTFGFPFDRPEPVVAVVDPDPVDDRVVTPPPTLTTGTIRGRVTREDGTPVANQLVRVGPEEGAREVTTGADGAFELADVAVGDTLVSVRAEGFQDAATTVTVIGGQTATADMTLLAATPEGQLRGVVLSFNGRPLAAQIRVSVRGDAAATPTQVTAGEDGSFQLDIAPGEYEVVISAPGHVEQRRQARVEENGVTVLNVDMRRGR